MNVDFRAQGRKRILQGKAQDGRWETQFRPRDEFRVHLELDGGAGTQRTAEAAFPCVRRRWRKRRCRDHCKSAAVGELARERIALRLGQGLKMLLDAFDPGFGAKLHGKFGEQPPRNPGAEIESGAARFFKGAFALRRQRFAGVAEQCLRLALCLGAARFRRLLRLRCAPPLA